MKSVDLPDKTTQRNGVQEGSDARCGDPPTVFLMANEFAAGGTEMQFITLARALQREKFGLRLGCIRRRGPLSDALGSESIAEFPLGGGFITATSLRSARALARYLRENKVAVAHSFSFYSNLFMIPVARASGVPVVIGSHRQLGDLLTPLQRYAQRACFRLCDRVVCNSRAAAERAFGGHVSDEKVVAIHNAVSQKFFRAGDFRPVSQATTGTVGLIARMNTTAKNHELFLRAAARLCARGSLTQLLLVGDGPLRSGLEQLAQQLGITDRTTFMGERMDIPEILTRLDVLALPSSSESSPNVIAEAMAAGVPVVTTRVGGVPELIEHGRTGILVPSDDEVALADRLEYCLRHPNIRERLARNARRFAVEHFSLSAVRDQYQSVYSECLSKNTLSGGRQLAFSSGPSRL
jgi:glycosyltransferase involved in cell wall biosynthesis